MWEKLYKDWKQSHSDLKPPHGFSRAVMKRIHEIETATSKTIPGLSGVEFTIPVHRVARWAFMIGLGALGVFRISYVAINILVP